MRSRRTLSLAKETLAELGSTDLAQVAGGTHLACPTHGASCDSCPTLPVNDCLTPAIAASLICFETS